MLKFYISRTGRDAQIVASGPPIEIEAALRDLASLSTPLAQKSDAFKDIRHAAPAPRRSSYIR
jgi:hypothetical protein